MANNNSFLAFLMGAATGAALALYLKSEKGKELETSKAKVSEFLDKIEDKLSGGTTSEEVTPETPEKTEE